MSMDDEFALFMRSSFGVDDAVADPGGTLPGLATSVAGSKALDGAPASTDLGDPVECEVPFRSIQTASSLIRTSDDGQQARPWRSFKQPLGEQTAELHGRLIGLASMVYPDDSGVSVAVVTGGAAGTAPGGLPSSGHLSHSIAAQVGPMSAYFRAPLTPPWDHQPLAYEGMQLAPQAPSLPSHAAPMPPPHPSHRSWKQRSQLATCSSSEADDHDPQRRSKATTAEKNRSAQARFRQRQKDKQQQTQQQLDTLYFQMQSLSSSREPQSKEHQQCAGQGPEPKVGLLGLLGLLGLVALKA
jgi:hypothetical protein